MSFEERIHPFMGSRVQLLQSWIPTNANNILDLGCAFGYVTKCLADKTRKVYGLDVNYKFIAEARENYSNPTFIVGSAEAIPFDNSFFDCVVMSEVLEHVADQEQSLSEVHRVLRLNGRLILTVPHRGPLTFLDPENIMVRLPKIRLLLYRLKWGTTNGMLPKLNEHRHYTSTEITDLLGPKFLVDKVFQSGFVIYSLATLFKPILKGQRLNSFINSLLSWDYSQEYGSFSSNIAIYAKKRLQPIEN